MFCSQQLLLLQRPVRARFSHRRFVKGCPFPARFVRMRFATLQAVPKPMLHTLRSCIWACCRRVQDDVHWQGPSGHSHTTTDNSTSAGSVLFGFSEVTSRTATWWRAAKEGCIATSTRLLDPGRETRQTPKAMRQCDIGSVQLWRNEVPRAGGRWFLQRFEIQLVCFFCSMKNDALPKAAPLF